eukprot:scaffold60483_cov39-Tisochrysis_lutea.AAC.3
MVHVIASPLVAQVEAEALSANKSTCRQATPMEVNVWQQHRPGAVNPILAQKGSAANACTALEYGLVHTCRVRSVV